MTGLASSLSLASVILMKRLLGPPAMCSLCRWQLPHCVRDVFTSQKKYLILSVHWDPPWFFFTLQQYLSEWRRNNTDGSIGLPATWPDRLLSMVFLLLKPVLIINAEILI